MFDEGQYSSSQAFQCPECESGIVEFNEVSKEWECNSCDWHKPNTEKEDGS